MKIANAFSLNMLAPGELVDTLTVQRLTLAQAQHIAQIEPESFIGHPDTAAVVSTQLGVPLVVNRASLSLAPGETLLVAQLQGPRLPEGATTLPIGASIGYTLVTRLAQ